MEVLKSKLDFKLVNGDCVVELERMVNDGVSVDMILTDPPYLMNYSVHKKIRNTDFCKPIPNDNNFELIHDVIPLLYDLLKPNGACYMFCNSNHIDYFKRELSQYFDFKNILVWVKNNWTGGDLTTTYGKRTEFILYMSKGKQHKLNGRRDHDVLFYDKIVGKKQLHQNQKPVPLLEFLISKSSQVDDTVLDCFMGSGSTGVACKNLNRNFIGIELEEKYYNMANKRINNTQTRLI